jgi:hypothetical protein
MKLSKLQQKTKLAAASAEEARARSAAASKTLEQIRERLHQAKLDLKKAKKRAKQAKREARRAVGDAASLAKSLAKAEKKTRKWRRSGEAREAAAGSERVPRPTPKGHAAPGDVGTPSAAASESGSVATTPAAENSSADSPELTVR